MTNKILHDAVKDAIRAICTPNCVDPHSYSLSGYCEWICNTATLVFQRQNSAYLSENFENIKKKGN